MRRTPLRCRRTSAAEHGFSLIELTITVTLLVVVLAVFFEALGYCRLLNLSQELALIEGAGLDITHVEDLTDSYVLTLRRWIDNVRGNRARIEELSPGFARVLQTYMSVAELSFARRAALEYMVLATKADL